MRPKLSDIAKKCGISIAQVSRAINDYPDVSLETRQYVKKIANEMGYKTNRTIKRRKSYDKRITLLIMNFDEKKEIRSITYANLIAGIERFCTDYHFELKVIFISERQKIRYTFEEFASRNEIYNCIIMGISEDDKYFREIEKSSRNIVLIDNYINNVNYVTSDDVTGMELVTEHLIEKGCKRFLFLGGNEDVFVSNQRELGFNRTLIKNKFRLSDIKYLYANFEEKEAYLKVEKLIKAKKFNFDAVVCVSDMCAIGVIKALNSYQITVPEKCLVTGYDGTIISSYFTPSLTTIKQDFKQKGYLAGYTIIQKLTNSTIEDISVPVKLIKGQST